jgi:hypothetical protein
MLTTGNRDGSEIRLAFVAECESLLACEVKFSLLHSGTRRTLVGATGGGRDKNLQDVSVRLILEGKF